MKEYTDLYLAIWENAIKEDVADVYRELYRLGDSIYRELYKTSGGDMEIITEKLKGLRKDLREYCRMKASLTEPRIKELVYQESQEWPNNKHYKNYDKEHLNTVKELREEVKVFAEKRIKARLRYLI
ncbi:MAG TPA: hypothetical protein VFC79_11465 [Tissierellaceae bacterium]|nr:hypothetical protein [Tissierellaceae bacterium]